jgi:hypothetical protein
MLNPEVHPARLGDAFLDVGIWHMPLQLAVGNTGRECFRESDDLAGTTAVSTAKELQDLFRMGAAYGTIFPVPQEPLGLLLHGIISLPQSLTATLLPVCDLVANLRWKNGFVQHARDSLVINADDPGDATIG